MVHVKRGKRATLAQLKRIKTPRPNKAGAYWKPLPHTEFIDTIRSEAKKRNWELSNLNFYLSNDKQDMIGTCNLIVPSIKAPAGQVLSMGFINSNAQRFAAKIAVGSTVLVCSNGIVTGEIVLQRKHTIGFNVQIELAVAFDEYKERAEELPTITQWLKQHQLTETQANAFLIEAGRRGLMPWSRIGQVDHEFYHPTYPEIGTGTAWALLNAFTLIAKQNPPLKQLDQIHEFLDLLIVSGGIYQAA